MKSLAEQYEFYARGDLYYALPPEEFKAIAKDLVAEKEIADRNLGVFRDGSVGSAEGMSPRGMCRAMTVDSPIFQLPPEPPNHRWAEHSPFRCAICYFGRHESGAFRGARWCTLYERAVGGDYICDWWASIKGEEEQ